MCLQWRDHCGQCPALRREQRVEFPTPPTFTPEHFSVGQPDLGGQKPLLAALGQLQFDLATWRMEHEFGAPVRLQTAGSDDARATDDASVPVLRGLRDLTVYHREDWRPLALFRSRWVTERVRAGRPEFTLEQVVF